MQEYSNAMNRSVESARKANQPELANRLKNVSLQQVEVLKQVENRVPENARKGIQTAINNSRKHQKVLERPARERGTAARPDNSDNKGLEIRVQPSGNTSQPQKNAVQPAREHEPAMEPPSETPPVNNSLEKQEEPEPSVKPNRSNPVADIDKQPDNPVNSSINTGNGLELP
jgi:hypothetical protein